LESGKQTVSDILRKVYFLPILLLLLLLLLCHKHNYCMCQTKFKR